MSILRVKVPSPSVQKIKELAFNNNLELDDVVDHYMSLVAGSINHSGGTVLSYDNTEITDSAIISNVMLSSLPKYGKMAEVYQDFDIEAELIKRVTLARQHYKDNCPEPDGLLLRQPIVTWHHRWVTAYIWILICCSDAGEYFPKDQEVVAMLFKRLEFQAIY